MTSQPTDSSHPGPLGLDVQLLYRPIGLVGAVVHKISDDAMHVDTGRVALEHLSEVEITFAHQREQRPVFHRIIAHVIRHAEGMTMLRFVRCSRDAHQALREIMETTSTSALVPDTDG